MMQEEEGPEVKEAAFIRHGKGMLLNRTTKLISHRALFLSIYSCDVHCCTILATATHQYDLYFPRRLHDDLN